MSLQSEENFHLWLPYNRVAAKTYYKKKPGRSLPEYQAAPV